LRRRRAGKQTAARAALRAAADAFDALAAEPWAQRARQETAATGAARRRRKIPSEAYLTPQELRVALVVANGATTREAASHLFLSPKTIEFHLGNIYAKLGVRSRAELARHPTLTASR
jgi:DNA-binding CsgD family transcriptional regulator